MPYKSKAQQRKFFAMESRGELPKGTALEWAHETPNLKSLPEHVKKSTLLAHAHDSGSGIAKSQLRAGEKVEMEHTKDRSKARDIAFDHLKEDPSYYTKLKKVEKSKYAAYRAPAGGMVARGTVYKGGEMVPDMGGKFMNPPKFNPAKMDRLRKKYKTMTVVMDEGTLGMALPGSSVRTRRLSRLSCSGRVNSA